MAPSRKDGEVDIAVHSRPRVMDDGTPAFGMTDRMTHRSLREYPHAVYAFQEGGFERVPVPGEGPGENPWCHYRGGPPQARPDFWKWNRDWVAFLVSFRVTRYLNPVHAGSPH